MTEHDQLDRLLERELETAVSDIRGDQRLTQTLMDGTLTRVRRGRRRRATAASAATSLAVVAAALVAWQLIGQTPSALPAVQVPKVAPTFTYHPKYPDHVDPLGWARSLPRGSDTTEPYVAGHALVVDGKRIDLGAHAWAQLEATVPGGWVGEYSNRVDRYGNQLDRRIGFLSREGDFRAFSFVHEPGSGHQTEGFAPSPDGTRVTYGGSIVDVATGVWVRYLPNRAQYVQAWTTAGIAYYDSSGRNMLWAPGSSPRPSDWEFVSPQTALQHRHGCTAIGHFGDDQVVGTIAVICHEGVSSVSNAGVAVMYTGKVVDLATGRVLGTLPVTRPTDGFFGNDCCLVSWTADNHLIFDVEDVSQHPRFLLISCDVGGEAVSCTRASNLLDALAWPVIAAH